MAVLIWTDGKSYDVPDDKVQQALADGFKQPTAADLSRDSAAQQPVRAAVESAVSNFVPVVGPTLVKSFSEGYDAATPEQAAAGIKARQEENPVSSVIGAGAGFLAGPAKVLKPFTAPLRAAGLLGTAAAGGLEGTAMGLSEAANESVLGDTTLTAERLASAAIAPALTGAAIDFGFGVVGKGASALIKKAGGSTVSEFLKSKGDDITTSMIDSKRWAKQYGAYEDDILRVAREEGVLHRGTSLDQASVQAAKAAEQRIWGQISDYLEGAQYFNPPKQPEVVDGVLTALKKYDRNPLAEGAMAEVQGVLEKMSAQNSTWSELWGLQSQWRKVADAGGQTVRNDVLDDARRALREYIMDNAPKKIATAQGTTDFASSLRTLNKRYAAMDAFERGLSDATAAFEARGLGAKEIAAGVIVGGPMGAATVAAGHYARKRGGFLLGETLNAMSESNLTKGLAESFRKNVAQRLATAPELLGPFRATLEAAAARGAMDLMETHTGLALSTVGPEYLTTMGMSPESPEEMAGFSQRLASLDAIKRAADAQEMAVSAAADGLFGSAPGRKARVGGSMSLKDYKTTMEGLRKVLTDPESMYAQIPPGLHGTAPMTVGQTAAAVLNAARYLDSKAPKNPYEGMPPAVAPQWEPSPAELDHFNRFREAVESPARVLKNMSQGYIAPEQVEALKAVYPAMYADLQQKIGERLMMQKKPLSYQQRLALSAVLGPTALGMSPQQVQVLQQSQALAWGQQAGQGKSVKPPDGRQAVDEEQIQTEAQKLEAR
jgi:hypothetical protein